MKVLIIDDQDAILETLSMFFLEKGFEVITSSFGEEGLEKVEIESPNIVILDIRLPDINGLEVLKKIRVLNENIFVIMITAFHDMETTIDAMKFGAYDYIHKPINIKELELSVEKIAEALNMRNKLFVYSNKKETQYKIDTIIGNSKPIQQIFKAIGLSCNTKATILIQGETGTGKELIAKAIHYNSIFKDEPFVSINCSAIVGTLLESELFGHEKGAFTNAFREKKGKFELAGNGTIFLDEIGELHLNTQVKILRFLQEREFEKVGGEKTIKSNARVITATNRDLAEMVKNGGFREDLFFRLKVININVPPLRDRKTDIPLLVDFFVHKLSNELHKKPKRISKDALNKILNYSWPGNVRELENVIMRAMVLARGNIILREHISIFSNKGPFALTAEGTHFKSLGEIEKEHITKALLKTHGHKGKACDFLKISRPTLRKKIAKYNIKV